MYKWGFNFQPLVMVAIFGTSACVSIWFLMKLWSLLLWVSNGF